MPPPQPQPQRQTNLPLAAASMIAAGAGFAMLGAIVRHVSADLDTAQMVFIRNVVALLCLAPWLLKNRRQAIRTSRLGAHLARTLFGLTAMYCFFYALAELTLAQAVLLNYTAPLFMPLFAYIWLQERSALATWAAVGIGFVGVYLILNPASTSMNAGLAAGLASGAFAAMAMMIIRRMSNTEPATRIVFYFTALSTAISAVPVLFVGIPLSTASLWMAVGGGIAVCSQLLITRGYVLAPAAQISPFTYSTVVFAALLGGLFWDEVLDNHFIVGAICVVVAGIATSIAKTKKAGAA